MFSQYIVTRDKRLCVPWITLSLTDDLIYFQPFADHIVYRDCFYTTWLNWRWWYALMSCWLSQSTTHTNNRLLITFGCKFKSCQTIKYRVREIKACDSLKRNSDWVCSLLNQLFEGLQSARWPQTYFWLRLLIIELVIRRVASLASVDLTT